MTDERPITVADIFPFLSPLGTEAVRAAVAEFKLAIANQQLAKAQESPQLISTTEVPVEVVEPPE